MSETMDPRAKATEALLASGAADAGRGGLGALKEAAAARFRSMGAPMARDEYWRYLGPAFNQPKEGAEPADAASATAPSPFAAAEPLVAAFLNGRFAPEHSSDLAAEGVEIAPLGAGAAPGWAAEALGALEAEGQSPAPRPLAALNGALATDGIALRATGAVARPIEIRHLGETGGAVHLRHVIALAPGASMTVLESGVGAAGFSSVMEAEIGAGASLSHVRLQTDPRFQRAATHLFARLGAESQFKSFTLSGATAGEVARNEAMLWLEGDDASAHLAGAVLAREDGKIDNTVFVTHGALRGESRQVFKNVLNDTAQGVFQGKILVREGAQQTDGYQISQSVLLSERAAFNAKPELEIYADDVKCSHGSTTGALDEAALFYLRSRGVAPSIARRLLIEAFLAEAVEEIADAALADIAREESRKLVAALVA
ncbi:MAG: SufD family Fe-S cluster assembly protein [Pseudomonadota bacterium]